MKELSQAVVGLAVVGLFLTQFTGCTSEPSGPPVAKSTAVAPVATNTTGGAPAEAAKVAEAASTNGVATAEAPLQRVAVQKPKLSPGVAEVVTMAEAKVANSVLLEYVNRSTEVYDLSVTEIVYLKDLGISEEVVAAMIRHGSAQAQAQGQAPAQAAETTVTTTTETVQSTLQMAPPVNPATNAAFAPLASTQPGVAQLAAEQPAPAAVAAAPVPAAAAPAAQYVVTEPPTQVTYNYFYESLSPYGSWVELPSYGWCWQPSCAVVDVSWRPYCHGGRWVYSNCGWYWASDYSWGWAPFHYGRWHHHPRCGWVWMPGYTWSPAWVSWRWGDAHCGWAPLPPAAHWEVGIGLTFHGRVADAYCGFGLGVFEWSFISCHDIHRPQPYHHMLARHEVPKFYSRTTVINNITINNNTVVNRGIAPEKITAITRREIPKVQLQDIRPNQLASSRPDQLDRSGSKLAVYRPSLPADLRAAPGKTAPVPATTVRRQQEISRSAVAPGASSPGLTRQSLAPSRSESAPSRTTSPALSPKQLSERPVTSSPSRVTSEMAPQRLSTSPQPSKGGAIQTQTPVRSSTPQVQTPASGTRSTAPQPRVTQPQTPSSSAPIRRETTAPVYTPRTATPTVQTPVSQGTRQVESAPTRVEPRKVETVAPAYSAPKLSSQQPAPSTPAYTQPSAAPSRPAQAAPSRPAPASPVRSYSAPAPAQVAPAQRSYQAPASPAPAQRSYQAPASPAPAQRSYQAPAPSAPSRPAQTAPSSGGGGRGRPSER